MNQPRRKSAFRIEPFRHKVEMDPRYAEKTWGILEDAIHQIYNHNASGLSFEELYRSPSTASTITTPPASASNSSIGTRLLPPCVAVSSLLQIRPSKSSKGTLASVSPFQELYRHEHGDCLYAWLVGALRVSFPSCPPPLPSHHSNAYIKVLHKYGNRLYAELGSTLHVSFLSFFPLSPLSSHPIPSPPSSRHSNAYNMVLHKYGNRLYAGLVGNRLYAGLVGNRLYAGLVGNRLYAGLRLSFPCLSLCFYPLPPFPLPPPPKQRVQHGTP
ncbi:unnamed protein product [Closterium sp. Yama58-4]|nr:unnamed protein product [Closterium sp. Yama58-4]